MTDAGRELHDARDEDRLPWLEAVDEDEGSGEPSALKLAISVLIALIAIGVVVGGIFWLKNREEAPQGDASVIPAPSSPYKVRPEQPGGMKVEGAGDSAYATSEGADTNGAIDLSAMPETAVTAGRSAPDAAAPTKTSPKVDTATPSPAADRFTPVPAKPAPAAQPAPKPVAARPAPKPAPKEVTIAKVPATASRAPVEAPPAKAFAPTATPPAADRVAAGGNTIQLGAFSSEAKANQAWKSLSHRYAYLSGLTPAVTPVTTGNGTLYRLRTSAGGQGGTICGKLKVAGETCAVID